MKKCSDEDVLKKNTEFKDKLNKKVVNFIEFRKQFEKYQRAKTGKQINQKSICRPYTEVFHQPQKRKNPNVQ